MFGRRTRFKKAKAPYRLINFHDGYAPLRSPSGVVTIMGVDPGSKSCGIYFLRVDSFGNRIGLTGRVLNFKTEEDNFGYAGVFTQFEDLIYLIRQCNYIGIEEQRTIAPQNIRIEQNIVCYLMSITRNSGFKPVVVRIDAAYKYTLVDCPRQIEDKKTWAVQQAALFHGSNREDQLARFSLGEVAIEGQSKLSTKKKREDFGDAVIIARCVYRLLNEKKI